MRFKVEKLDSFHEDGKLDLQFDDASGEKVRVEILHPFCACIVYRAFLTFKRCCNLPNDAPASRKHAPLSVGPQGQTF